jgi:hypothetical protein
MVGPDLGARTDHQDKNYADDDYDYKHDDGAELWGYV